MTRARWIWLLLFLGVLLRTAWISDDALITLRTVLNATHGYGLTFNIAERVQTFTHPLWLALLTLSYWVVGNIFYGAFVLSIVVSLVLYGVILQSARTAIQLWIAAGVLLASRAFVDYSSSGLENPLTALVAVATLGWAARGAGGRRWLAVIWMGVSAAYLTRPDAVLLVLPVALWAAWRLPKRAAVVSMAVGLLPAVLWTVFSLVYYGFAAPNTAYAKLAADIHYSERVWQGVLYLLDSINRDPITLVAIGAAVVVASLERSRDTWLAVVGVLVYLGYVVWIGGDFMSGRFLAAPLAVSVWVLARATRIEEREWRPVAVGLALAALASPHPPLLSDRTFNAAEPMSGIVDERGVYFQTWGLARADRLMFAEPEWPRWVPGVSPNYVLDTCGLMGAAGIEWGPRTHLLDECALADPLLARLPAVWNEEWRPGHYRRKIPDGYRESLERGTNDILDPSLAGYYGALRTITRSTSLWSTERLGLIWQMNRGAFDARINRPFYKFDGGIAPVDTMSTVTADTTPWDGAGVRSFTTVLAVTCEDKKARRILDISLDSDDRYRLTFLKNKRIVGVVVVDVVPRNVRQPGLASHLVTIPERARRGGFDTIVIVAPASNGQRAVGHLLLDGEPGTDAELGRRLSATPR